MDNKYSHGKIYAVRNAIDDDVYVGSTCSSLSQRMVKHRSASAKCVKMRLYDKMQELGAEKFYIELVEDCPCENVEQLRRREGELIRQMGTLNKRIDGRTKAEYSQDNREKKLQYMADNREYLLQKRREYNELHREEIRAKDKARYEAADKQEIYQKAKEWKCTKIECSCGGKYTLAHKAEHEQSRRHRLHVDSQSN